MVIVVIVVIPLLPSYFITAPSSAAAKGGDLQTRYDRGGRYVPSPSILKRV